VRSLIDRPLIANSLCCGSITAYSLYAPLLMTHLHYPQSSINILAIAAELAMYLPVPISGYLCDRTGPRPVSLAGGILFGVGYLLAALVYQSGPPASLGGHGWPFGVMVVAFVAVGTGTTSMYMAAVSTCAKNFGRGKYKGIALAVPIAAFGLSGMWLSQLGSRVLYIQNLDGSRGDVDVFRFFLFLSITLFTIGALGAFALRIYDEESLIEGAIDELEQSGVLHQDEFFRAAANQHGYGTLAPTDLSVSTVNFLRSEAASLAAKQAEERARKNWLLNAETRRFLADRTMWVLMAGFFLVTGPGEAFINNMGTLLPAFYPRGTPAKDIPTDAATHVSVIALMSTASRLLTGTLTDVLAPREVGHPHTRGPNSVSSSMTFSPKRFSVSRVWFLLLFALLLSLGQALLASGIFQSHAESFWIVSALVGGGYGAVFSLTPILISVIWGVENFATNWGIVATVPAVGAAMWGSVYSAVYEAGRKSEVGVPEGEMCYGMQCYSSTFWAMAASVWVACGLWVFAWKGPGGWTHRMIAV